MDSCLFGLMASNTLTGECFAAYSSEPPADERASLISCGALIERRPLSEIKEAFCECNEARRIVEYGPTIGSYRGCAIPDWVVTADGLRHAFSHVCSLSEGFGAVTVGDLVIAPGVVLHSRG